MKKAVFFDIDGTIWDEKQQIPDSTREALRLLKEQGHYMFLCSGRTRVFIPEEELMPLGFDGVLAGCGTYVEFEGDVKYYHKIDGAQIRKDCAYMDSLQASYILEGRYALYMDKERFPEKDPFYGKLKTALEDKLLPVSGNEENFEVSKFCVSYIEQKQRQELLEQELGKRYTVIPRVGNFMEIIPKEHNKATGIQEICRILGIAHEDTYAFGDSTNDLDMLRYVAHSVAMGDGMQEAKEAAEYVTKNLWEDGIYHGLKHYGLI